MPNKKYIDKGEYQQEIIEWQGLTSREEEMANSILGSLYSKEYILIEYANQRVDNLMRMTGDFWLNNNDEPFQSEEEVEEWIEQHIKKAEKITAFCRYTDEEKYSLIK